MQHPNGPTTLTVRATREGSIGLIPNASSKGGDWRTIKAENAISRSPSAWLLRDGPFSGTLGGTAVAAYLRRKLRTSSREFCTSTDSHR